MSNNPHAEISLGGSGMRTRIVSMSLLAVFAVIAIKGLTVALNGPDAVIARVAASEAPIRRADIVDRNGLCIL